MNKAERIAGQTRMTSLIEVMINVVIGFSISWCANMLVFPLFGFAVTGTQAFNIGLIFTVISVARAYIIRRWFNSMLHKVATKVSRTLA